ncbi:MAG: hypothetical protein U0840_01890 [Gemmataceae bacterium]
MSLLSRIEEKAAWVTPILFVPAFIGMVVGYFVGSDGSKVLFAIAGGQIGLSIGGGLLLFLYMLALICNERRAVGVGAWVIGAATLLGALIGTAAGITRSEDTLGALAAAIIGFACGVVIGGLGLGYNVGRLYFRIDCRWGFGEPRGVDYYHQVTDKLVIVMSLFVGLVGALCGAIAGWVYGPGLLFSTWRPSPLLCGPTGGILTAAMFGGAMWLLVARKIGSTSSPQDGLG